MALAPEILAVVTKIRNTKLRQGDVFILDENGATPPVASSAAKLGRVRDVTVEFAPVLSEADSHGRQSTMGYTVTATFVMQQTDEEAELLAAAHLGYPDSDDFGQDGFNVLFSNIGGTAAQAVTAWNAASGANPTPLDGIGFRKALLQISPNINFAGAESMITVTFTGVIPADRLKVFGTRNIISLV